MGIINVCSSNCMSFYYKTVQCVEDLFQCMCINLTPDLIQKPLIFFPEETPNMYKRQVWNAWENTQNLKRWDHANYMFYNPLILSPFTNRPNIYYLILVSSAKQACLFLSNLSAVAKKNHDYYKTITKQRGK